MTTQLNGSTVDGNDSANCVGRTVRKFNDDVRTPRLPGDDRSVEAEFADEKLEVMSNGRHVESVVGFRTESVSPLVDGDDRVPQRCKVASHSVPQPGVGCKPMNEQKRHDIGG